MGFDIYIHCTLHICKNTGKHYYYKGYDKIYDIPPRVPEEYREFINMKGSVFRIYTNLITDELGTSVENFLDKYPRWTDVVEDSDFEGCSHYWNENKHDRFYATLKWFSEQGICYMISWSY